MRILDRAALAVLHRFDAETAHDLAIAGLRSGLMPPVRMPAYPRLRVTLAGLELPNPVGLAAGFDKNARVLAGLARAGFGFVEVGGVTPRPQGGNARPRVWRFKPQQAVINAMGLNNDGAQAVARRLRSRPRGALVGLNIGANKDSADRAADYAEVLATCGPYLDFATLNVSSPNTERLRELQGAEALAALLAGVMAVRDGLPRRLPVFVKIAPDLDHGALVEIAAVVRQAGVDAVVATNTTVARDGMPASAGKLPGGLSGRPLFAPSTRVLARLSVLMDGQVPLIGVGGVADGATAYAKIRAGATAVQLYTGLVFGGFSLVARICAELDALLARDGFDSVAAAVGTGRDEWLEGAG